jgi:uncharacterized RDD family membrane protein YckC
VACAEGTVPHELSVAGVWVRPDGHAFLLGLPLEATEARSPAADDQRALALLGGVVVLALEGRERPADRPTGPVRAPLPLHAAGMLARLLGAGQPYAGAQELQADLAATEDRPTRVGRPRRALQMILQAGAVLAALFVTGAVELALKLGQGPLIVVLAGVIAPLGLVWAALARGGPSLGLAGLALVRADGRRAAWWQAVLRCVLAWAQVGGLVTGLLLVAATLKEVPDQQAAFFYCSAAVILGYLVFAVWLPRRPLHDRLARTSLVPR